MQIRGFIELPNVVAPSSLNSVCRATLPTIERRHQLAHQALSFALDFKQHVRNIVTADTIPKGRSGPLRQSRQFVEHACFRLHAARLAIGVKSSEGPWTGWPSSGLCGTPDSVMRSFVHLSDSITSGYAHEAMRLQDDIMSHERALEDIKAIAETSTSAGTPPSADAAKNGRRRCGNCRVRDLPKPVILEDAAALL